MKSSRLPRYILCVVLSLCGWSAAAYGCSISFLGNCSWSGGNNPASCSFSTYGNGCGNAISSGCHWDFGDGGTSSACSLASHTYSTPASDGAETVTFTLTCSDGCVATAQRYVCFTVGTSGCIEANQGWN